nr:integrase, catalytic region, zinc finger, CCHC-type, peptidase aspartic, catalytic [Tanacetum cinerariifolium]
EGEPVDSACSGGITSAIGAITSGAGGSTLGGGKAFWIYNRRTRRIVKTIHVDFDELMAMASEQSSSGLALHEMTYVTISSGLVPKPTSSTSYVPPSRND